MADPLEPVLLLAPRLALGLPLVLGLELGLLGLGLALGPGWLAELLGQP